MLSRAASDLRRSLDEDDLYAPDEPPAKEISNQQSSTPPAQGAALDLDAMEDQVLEFVGRGGVEAEDFELVRQLGQLSVAQQQALQLEQQAGLCSTRVAVIAYAAIYYPRLAMPFERGAVALLKEFLPAARAIGHNELLVTSQLLSGLPKDKFQAISCQPASWPPVVPLIGYFSSAATMETESLSSSDSEDVSSSSSSSGGSMDGQRFPAVAGFLGPTCPDSLWLVYKWEGLRPLHSYLDRGPPTVTPRLFQNRAAAEAEAWSCRVSMLRAVVSGVLSALSFCHAAGVTHGSLCSSTVLLSSLEDADHAALSVKVDNFGFGTWYSSASSSASRRAAAPLASVLGKEHESLRDGERADLQAAGLLFVELLACGLAPERGAAPPRDSLQRLLWEVFPGDILSFRDYCLQDEQVFGRMVDVLDGDEQAGWSFLDAAVRGATSADELRTSRFLKPPAPTAGTPGGWWPRSTL